MTPWLLTDYGDVISRPYDDTSAETVAARLGLSRDELDKRYWAGQLRSQL